MAKHLIKATHSGNQIRISIPIDLLQEMRWKKVSYFILEKTTTDTVSIKKLIIKGVVE
jgi:hypothetical protein